jgi:aryl-alcohol dehydrogenase-like predicted oxidoreductase
VDSSRRNFLVAGLALPAAASASRTSAPETEKPAKPPAAAPALTYRTLGKTGLKVTSVGFGCMVTSDASVIERAADLGITYFDTARGYGRGNNERMVGAALKNKRKGVVLSTKSHSSGKDEALKDLDTSLKELGTDYVDIWYLHGKGAPEEVTDGLVEAQQIAKKAGKIRFAGVSTHNGHQKLIPFLAQHPQIDVILSSYNFTMEPVMEQLLAQAAAAGKGIVAMKVMAGGSRRGGNLAALKWVLKNPGVGTTIPSITDMDQLDENLKAMGSKFGAVEEKLLARQLELIHPLYCRMCGRCDGQCREGLPVEAILRFATYADGYGEFTLARERFNELPAEHARAVCGSCAGCTVECPHGVNVPARMAHAQDLFAC